MNRSILPLALALACIAAALTGCEPKPKEPKAEGATALQLALAPLSERADRDRAGAPPA